MVSVNGIALASEAANCYIYESSLHDDHVDTGHVFAAFRFVRLVLATFVMVAETFFRQKSIVDADLSIIAKSRC